VKESDLITIRKIKNGFIIHHELTPTSKLPSSIAIIEREEIHAKNVMDLKEKLDIIIKEE